MSARVAPTRSSSSRVGPFKVAGRLGVGGMSEVLLAIASGPCGFERSVVVKRLLPRFARDAAATRALAREALACARLQHPNVVRLYEFVELDGEPCIVLEHVDGLSLGRMLGLLAQQGGRLPDAVALYIADALFSALAAAHDLRDARTGASGAVVHRDLSPGNVLLSWDGFVKLADFGIARLADVGGETEAGTIHGTSGYMAPEQVTSGPIGPHTDVYGACLLLRELLVGERAFSGDEVDVLRAMSAPRLRPLHECRPGVAANVAAAVARGLRPDPAKRDLSAAEMHDILRREFDAEDARRKLAVLLAQLRPSAAAAPRGADEFTGSGFVPASGFQQRSGVVAMPGATVRVTRDAPTPTPSAPIAPAKGMLGRVAVAVSAVVAAVAVAAVLLVVIHQRHARAASAARAAAATAVTR